MAEPSDNDPELRAYLLGQQRAFDAIIASWSFAGPHNNRTLAAYVLGLHHGKSGQMLPRGDLKTVIDSTVSGAESQPPNVPQPPPEDPIPPSGFSFGGQRR